MDSKSRFTNRVENYVKYRPSYGKDAVDFLYETIGFRKEDIICDMGSGTGIFSKLLLERGSEVIGLEPNEAMREEAMKQLAGFPNYKAAEGSAEETGLEAASVNHIVCAQSFHWFDQELAKREMKRILKPGGKVALIWNSRKTTGSPFLEQFEQLLLDFGADYEKVGHKSITQKSLQPFFAEDGPNLERFVMRQRFDETGLLGRLLSSSYCPLPGQKGYDRMIDRLRRLFEENESGGCVTVEYDTELYWGEV
ncbi:class I SAM-dependent methyltransferase [Paenibacillus sp. HB172176]|uniref:class I SAM-dependent methyltransferase n=1 Tax=Paenibacillus sp. HB172176 TaxID=2493690 RepID=UPI001438716E|nr:class I SAM-dependent methyltransferase [Paenibacillus sp. HB172176]